MRKLSSNKPLLFSLITAFLFLQWSTPHIHLAGEHEHDGAQHHHAATSHQHQLVSHHPEAIDVADNTLSHAEDSKVIELEHVCTQQHSNLGKLFAVIPSTTLNIVKCQVVTNNLVAAYQQDVFQPYHQYTSIRLRAPPLIS